MKKLIAVGPTANWSPKIWPPQNYLFNKKTLKNKVLRFNFVLLGPESEEDKTKLILSNNNKKNNVES